MLGGGSWATALTKILSENGARVSWWLRNKDDVQHLLRTRHNPRYLSAVAFDLNRVRPATDLAAVVQEADWLVLAVPAAFVQPVLDKLDRDALKGKRVVSAIKGMIPGRNELVTDYVAARFRLPTTQLGVVAGPCHAEEVALEKQSYLTIGSPDLALAEAFSHLLRNRYVKAYPAPDLDGIEYAAVMKNIIALTGGIAHGLGYGDNFLAVLVSNAVQEIRRFVHAISPQPRDFSASAYLGDLLVTAYSQFSRNRTFGKHDRAGLLGEVGAAGDEHGGRGLLRRQEHLRAEPGATGGNAHHVRRVSHSVREDCAGRRNGAAEGEAAVMSKGTSWLLLATGAAVASAVVILVGPVFLPRPPWAYAHPVQGWTIYPPLAMSPSLAATQLPPVYPSSWQYAAYDGQLTAAAGVAGVALLFWLVGMLLIRFSPGQQRPTLSRRLLPLLWLLPCAIHLIGMWYFFPSSQTEPETGVFVEPSVTMPMDSLGYGLPPTVADLLDDAADFEPRSSVRWMAPAVS